MSSVQTPRTALVSGAAHGIGAGIATRLVRDGWQVVIADTDPAGTQLAAALGPAARFVPCDVGSEPDVAALLAGVPELDALICNAGIMIRKPLGELSLAEWNRVLAVNLTSTFLLARAAEAKLRLAKGAIVTVASTRARQSEPDTEAYAATKGGLVALTHALAISLGPDVRVNCISPGWIETKGDELRPIDHSQQPVGRVGRVEDIAALAAWLIGPESGFVTGAEFVSDGGMTRKMIYAE